MLKTLFAREGFEYFDDHEYFRASERFTEINLDRVQKISLTVFIVVLFIVVVPDIIIFLSVPEKQSQDLKSLIFLETSLAVFMLLFRAAAARLKTEKHGKYKNALVNAFVLTVLLHASGISVFTFSLISGVSVFLLVSCAVMVCFYWPARKTLLFIGGGNLAFILALYLVFREPDIFYYHLVTHSFFLVVFFVLSRTVLELKIKDIQSIERMEMQSAELKSSNKMLRMTEHTLNSINRNMHQGIFRYEKNNGFTYVNDYFADLLGYSTPAELITDKKAVFLSRRLLDEISRKVNDQGFMEGIESEIGRKDGSKLWVQVNCSVRRDENTSALLFEGSATDISFRKKALQEALENAARLEQAEKIAHTGFYEINVSTGEITCSTGFREILECSPEGTQYLQQHLSFVHPGDKNLVEETILKAVSGNKQFSLEYRIVSSRGNTKYLKANAGLVRDEKGNRSKVLVAVQDVTEIKLSQKALAQSEAFFKAAFNDNRFGICILDTQYNILAFNDKTAQRIEEWKDTKLKKGQSILNYLLPATRQALEPAFKRALEGHKTLLEHNLMGNTLQETWTELYISPVKDTDNQTFGIIIMGNNISERKKNEELLANLSLVASKTDNAVMISDRKHRVEWVNEAFERNTGFKLSEIKDRFPKEFLVTEKTDLLTLNTLNNSLREAKSFNDEILICNKNGKDSWVQLTINPVFNKDGKHIKFVSVYTDLSKIKAYEQQLRIVKEKAERSVEIKENFLSTVSHELRTPLNAVIGLTHHMLQNEPREDQLEDLNILKFSAENLLNLINDILDLSKIEAGKVKIEKIVFNFRDIINSLRQSFQSQAEDKGVQFKVFMDEQVPDSLKGDSIRLIQILANLLSNAVKFTSHGTVSLSISSKQKENNYCTLQIQVEDTGMGIPEDKLDLIFEKFEQGSLSSGQGVGGTGLGLAITKQLVELQGGQISVKSTYGKGACFTVSLTYQIPQPKDLEFLTQVPARESEADLKQLNVLLVEDNKINQAVAGKFLKNWNIPFSVAYDGEEAIQKATETQFTLILMDLQMPVMDGYTATRQLRRLKERDYSKIPIIAITAEGSGGIEHKILAAGMNDMIFKPFKPDDLLAKLNQYCPFKKDIPNLHQMLHSEEPKQQIPSTVLDLSGIAQLAGDDASFLQEVLRLYIDQFTILGEETGRSLKKQDIMELRRILHKMKPSVAMLKQERMQNIGSELHILLHKENPDFSDINLLASDYLAEMESLKKLLRKELEKSNFVLD